MSRRRRRMTKAEAVREFRQLIMPRLRRLEERGSGHTITGRVEGKKIDYPRRREAWGIYTDGLLRSGDISLNQYERWESPALVVPPWRR
jgi:hypothetical protein